MKMQRAADLNWMLWGTSLLLLCVMFLSSWAVQLITWVVKMDLSLPLILLGLGLALGGFAFRHKRVC